jgi:hypothetical protein
MQQATAVSEQDCAAFELLGIDQRLELQASRVEAAHGGGRCIEAAGCGDRDGGREAADLPAVAVGLAVAGGCAHR